MRRVLMICEKFPPFNTSGAGRPFYFAKYLPELGYEPLIVASTLAASDDRDDALLAELPPEVRVWRTPRLISPAIHRLRASAARRATAGARQPVTAAERLDRASGLRGIVPYLGWWLHWEVDWGMFATAAGWAMAKGNSPEVLWVSAPHFRSLPIATRLAAALSIPLVVDLRDPWTYGSLWRPKTPAIARAERRWASRVLGAASRIVFTSPLTLEAMHERFPELERSRLVTITNGFDDTPIQPLREQPAEQCLFRYVGMLNDRRQPDPLITAFARAAQADPEFQERAALEFVGNAGGHERKSSLAPGCQIKFRGPVSRADSLRLMAGSDVNILLQTIAEGQDVVSGKAFDYLHAKRPILAAVDEAGGDAWLVRETGAGSVVPWSDPEAVARALVEYFRRHQAGLLSVPAQDIERFSRRRLTARLARLLDDVVEGVVDPARDAATLSPTR